MKKAAIALGLLSAVAFASPIAAQDLPKVSIVVFGAPSLGAFLPPVIKAQKLDEKNGLSINFEDELVKATVLTHGGKVVHPAFAGAEAEVKAETVAPVKEKAAAPKAAARKTTTKKPAASKAKSTLSGGEA